MHQKLLLVRSQFNSILHTHAHISPFTANKQPNICEVSLSLYQRTKCICKTLCIVCNNINHQHISVLIGEFFQLEAVWHGCQEPLIEIDTKPPKTNSSWLHALRKTIFCHVTYHTRKKKLCLLLMDLYRVEAQSPQYLRLVCCLHLLSVVLVCNINVTWIL